jgi:hypothetical protein
MLYDVNIKSCYEDLFEIKISNSVSILFIIKYQNIDLLINIVNKIFKKKLNIMKAWNKKF